MSDPKHKYISERCQYTVRPHGATVLVDVRGEGDAALVHTRLFLTYQQANHLAGKLLNAAVMVRPLAGVDES